MHIDDNSKFMITVTFCVCLKTRCLRDFFDRIINTLNFTPDKMDVYYNEFSVPKLFVKYDPKLTQHLSSVEVDGGITAFSLYDSEYTNENVTPFFRAKILDTTFTDEQVVCMFEWVSYSTLYFNPDVHFLDKYLCDDVKIFFLFAYNQFDVKAGCEKTSFLKTLMKPRSRWGKMVMVNSMPFVAAPVMFLGKDYFGIIHKEALLKAPNSQEIMVKGQEVVSVKLFGLDENPNLHRDIQKKYWKATSLSHCIKKYQEKEFSVDAIVQYKARYKKMQAQNHKKRDTSCL